MSMLSVPLKTILMYHADTTGESIPVGYEICDGRLLGIGTHDIGGGTSTYQLPDLRNQFILGADLTKGVGVTGGTTNSATDAPGPKGTGGNNGLSLSTGNLPAHNHSISDPGHAHLVYSDDSLTDRGAGSGNPEFLANAPGTSPTVQSGFASTGISINNTGSGTPVDNRPRYYGLVMIMKTKL